MSVKCVLPPMIDFSKFVGEWVVICENKVVGHDKNLSKLEKEIKQCKRTPTITKIPKEEVLIF